MQKNIENRTKVMFSQQSIFFFFWGCISGAWARVVAAGRTLKQLSPETLQFPLAKTKPYHYPNRSRLCAPCQDETRRASHTNMTLIAHCRASNAAVFTAFMLFARVV